MTLYTSFQDGLFSVTVYLPSYKPIIIDTYNIAQSKIHCIASMFEILPQLIGVTRHVTWFLFLMNSNCWILGLLFSWTSTVQFPLFFFLFCTLFFFSIYINLTFSKIKFNILGFKLLFWFSITKLYNFSFLSFCSQKFFFFFWVSN